MKILYHAAKFVAPLYLHYNAVLFLFLAFSPIPRLMENLSSNYEHWKIQYESPNSSEGETEVQREKEREKVDGGT